MGETLGLRRLPVFFPLLLLLAPVPSFLGLLSSRPDSAASERTPCPPLLFGEGSLEDARGLATELLLGPGFLGPRLLAGGFALGGVSDRSRLLGTRSEVLSFLPGPAEVEPTCEDLMGSERMGDFLVVTGLGSGDADSGEDDREEEEEERLEEDDPELLLPLLLALLELLLRSLLRRHADCDPLSRKGQSVSFSLATPLATAFTGSFLPALPPARARSPPRNN